MRLMNPAGLLLRASPRTGYGWGTAALFPRCPGLLGTSTRWHMLKPLQHALQGPNRSVREVSKVQAAMSRGVPIPHLAPWSLSHMGPCGGAVHFGERTADISIQTPPDQPAASLAGRTSCLVGLCSGSCDTTAAQRSSWPGGVVATAVLTSKRVAAGSPERAPESGQDLAL